VTLWSGIVLKQHLSHWQMKWWTLSKQQYWQGGEEGVKGWRRWMNVTGRRKEGGKKTRTS